MSSAVADRLGLRERGLLRRGLYADVVIFDPQTIGDRATFEDPWTTPYPSLTVNTGIQRRMRVGN